MFTKIMVPLDESSFAEHSLDVAVAIARASGGTLDLLLAQPPGVEARIYLNAQADRVAADGKVQATSHVETGEPVTAICERARALGSDLIVINSHGRTGLGRAWLGSVADGVARATTVPVLMLRAADRTRVAQQRTTLFRRILIALDGSEQATAVLPAAVDLAHCSGGVLILARVVAPLVDANRGAMAPRSSMAVDRERTRALVTSTRIELADLADRLQVAHGLRVEIAVTADEHPAAAIVKLARAKRADLIALTSHGRGRSRLVIGSVTDKVLRSSTLPLLLSRSRADHSLDVGETPMKER
jgi:nucleotide-binding universal stress UspA family protein